MIKLMAFAQTRENINQYAKDKLWYWHLSLWLFGAFVFVKLLGFNMVNSPSFVIAVPYAFDFMLHEMAHIVTAWLPSLLTAAAGSGSELLLGAGLVYGAYRFRNYFASLFCWLWLMLACMSVGSYMADAVPMRIPLVSLGGALSGSEQTIHDWNFIFGKLHMLGASGFIGGMFRVAGVLAGLFGLIFTAWIMYKMAAAKDAKVPEDKPKLLSLSAWPTGDQTADSKGHIYPNPTKGNMAERQVTQHRLDLPKDK